MKLKQLLLAGTFLIMGLPACMQAEQIILVTPNGTNDIQQIRNAIETAKTYSAANVTIKLGGGSYHLHRNQATVVKYFISNTMSWNGSPDNMKYIGVYLKSAKNITIDGEGAKLITHGEITSIVIDECENITLKNLTVDAADPSVTEMTVESISGNTATYKAHETSDYQISGNTLTWKGEYGWTFNGGGVAPQVYDPKQDITWRSVNPFSNITSLSQLGNKRISASYSSFSNDIQSGRTFQMRDAIRDQVAGFIHKSMNVTYDNVIMNFLGNFGIVCQYSDTLSFLHCRFAPDESSGRSNAGFADFLQVSGCKGLLKVEDSYFIGAHDDPINIHGTYLKIQTYNSPTQTKVQFMHHESWGFEAFFVGDSIEFVDVASMMPIQTAKITVVTRNDDRNITLSFDNPVDIVAFQAKSKGVVIENISWTPEVEIRRNYFSRVPTRGVLLTTRRRAVIEENTFFRMQMAGIYVSGDAASWYESGKVTDLTIRNNKFIECGSPVIFFDPTNSVSNGYVHSNVKIEGNIFTIKSGNAVGGKSVEKLSFTNNTVIHTGTATADSYVSLNNSGSVIKAGNIKLQPGAVVLYDLTTQASSSIAGRDKSTAIDGESSTFWQPETSDTGRWWTVDFGKGITLNRIVLNFPSPQAWKYVLEVSADNIVWSKVIDQNDNSISGISFTSIGNLGKNIRYLRVSFGNNSAALAEVNIFGDEKWEERSGLISGTVIGTNGSWNGNSSVTKEYVFDFNTNTFFDSPSGFAWVGLDFGKDTKYQIDSIRYSPRYAHEYRMPNGVFEVSNMQNFDSKTTLFTIPAAPSFDYHVVSNLAPHAASRYARYACPSDGFGNISEIEFYGKSTTTALSSKWSNDFETIILLDRQSKRINLQFPEYAKHHTVFIFDLTGRKLISKKTMLQEFVIDYEMLPKGFYIVSVLNDKQQSATRSISL